MIKSLVDQLLSTAMISKLKHKLFRVLERYLRLHVLPVHYYSPIPCVSEITPDTYTRPLGDIGINLRSDSQINYYMQCTDKYFTEFNPYSNTGLSRIDSFMLYSIIRDVKPSKIVEIGSGESTLITLSALEQNRKEGHESTLLAVEPYPTDKLLGIRDQNFFLSRCKVQDVTLGQISDADILFIDSSHVSKIGSDVNHEIFKIIPSLKKGSLVHWHDIMLPWDYPKTWIDKGTFWNESYLVHAFMMYNNAFEVIWSGRHLQESYRKILEKSVLAFNPHDPQQQLSSFWVRKVK